MNQQMKSRVLSGLVVAMVVALAAASTFAHDKGMGDGHDMMSRMDANHDGMVSKSEHDAYAQSMFDRMDANHDGMVSRAEMDAGMKAMQDGHSKDDKSMAGATDSMDHHDADSAQDNATPPTQ
ncbi:MAG: hypothetical protein ACJ8GK_03915 [Luteimonas sp.]